ncbi:hypothetical protein P879_11482 [Paragonimus westermani]|uniref:Uncharacterized protein n=1 Tax=Paragonimus westermani TaxID=34504 RepID=A0A8T0DDV9_9TREM|nr:hypothetical protein P879_11482 [Paragonimus westermani]
MPRPPVERVTSHPRQSPEGSPNIGSKFSAPPFSLLQLQFHSSSQPTSVAWLVSWATNIPKRLHITLFLMGFLGFSQGAEGIPYDVVNTEVERRPTAKFTEHLIRS